MQKPVLIENQDGRFLVLPNDTLGQQLLRGERWEPLFSDLVSVLVHPTEVVVDVGANIGYNSVILANVVGPFGRVHSFEALRITYQQLCGNVFLNGLENVSTYNVALGSEDHIEVSMISVDYSAPNINIMNSCLGVGGEFIEMRTLDAYNFNKLAALKIDVQGSEILVLRGAEQTIQRTRPIIFIEIEEAQLANQNFSQQQLMTEILSLHYNLVWLDPAGFDWGAVPVENPEKLAILQQIAGPACQTFHCPLV